MPNCIFKEVVKVKPPTVIASGALIPQQHFNKQTFIYVFLQF